jgi:hypothetical protein
MYKTNSEARKSFEMLRNGPVYKREEEAGGL